MPTLSALRRPLATLAGSAALLLPLAAAAQNAVVTQPAQLFAGPAPDYPVVATVYPGVEVSVVGCLADYLWCDVTLQDGLRGWAYGPSLAAYGWMGNALPVPDYGPSLGIPLVSFFIGDYWGRHYRHQPWFDEYRWRQRPPPPPRFVPPPHPRDGWQAPYPPRWQQPGMPPRDDRRDEHWHGDGQPHRDFNRGDRPQIAPPPLPQQPPQQPPQFHQDPGRNFNPRPDERRNDGARQQPVPPRFAPTPAPAPAPVAPQIAPPQPPRLENRFTPPPQPQQPQAQPQPRGGDGPRNRFGGRMEER